jgi:hypothetical protein
LPHFAYENAATSFLLLLLLFKLLFIFLFLTTFFYTGDFRFLKSGTFKTDLFSRCTARPTIFLSLNRRPLNIGIILLTEKPQRGAAYRYVRTAHKAMSVLICPNVCQYF